MPIRDSSDPGCDSRSRYGSGSMHRTDQPARPAHHTSQLCRQAADGSRHPHIRKRARQLVIFEHSCDVQVFDPNDGRRRSQMGRELVLDVTAQACHIVVRAGELLHGFLPVLAHPSADG